jgi:hypothetical protein
MLSCFEEAHRTHVNAKLFNETDWFKTGNELMVEETESWTSLIPEISFGQDPQPPPYVS